MAQPHSGTVTRLLAAVVISNLALLMLGFPACMIRYQHVINNWDARVGVWCRAYPVELIEAYREPVVWLASVTSGVPLFLLMSIRQGRRGRDRDGLS